MKKIFIAFFILTAIYSNSYALDQALFFGCGSSAVSNSAVNYISPFANDRAASATEGAVSQIVSSPGTISYLAIRTATAPTQTYVYKLRNNGADTALTCTITGASTTCVDNTHSVSVSAGDVISISSTPSGTPTANNPQGSMIFTSTGNITSIYGYNSSASSPSVSATNYYPINGSGGTAATAEANVQFIMPEDGDFLNLYTGVTTAPDNGGGTQSLTFTFRVNGIDTALTNSISEASTSASDLSHRISVKAGDLVSISTVPSGTPTSPSFTRISVTFKSHNGYYFLLFSNSNASSTSASAARYNTPIGVNLGLQTAASAVGLSARFSSQLYIKTLYASLVTAPDNGGGTQSYDVSLYDSSGAAATSVTCNVAETAKTCSYLGSSFTAAINNSYSVSFVPSGTPATSIVNVSLAASMKATSTVSATVNGY